MFVCGHEEKAFFRYLIMVRSNGYEETWSLNFFDGQIFCDAAVCGRGFCAETGHATSWLATRLFRGCVSSGTKLNSCLCVCVCYFRPFLTQLHRTPVSEWKVVRRLTLSECETSFSCPRFISQVGQGLSPGDTVQ